MSGRRSRLEFSHAIMHEIFRFRLMYQLIATLVLIIIFLMGFFYPERYKSSFSFKLLDSSDNFQLDSAIKKLESYEFLSELKKNLATKITSGTDIAIIKSALSIQNSDEIVTVAFETDSANRSYEYAKGMETLLFESQNTDQSLKQKSDSLALALLEKREIDDAIVELDNKIGSYKSLSIKTDLVKVSNKVRRLKDSLDDVDVELVVVDTKLRLLNQQIDDELKLQTDLKSYQSLKDEESRLLKIMEEKKIDLKEKDYQIEELKSVAEEFRDQDKINLFLDEKTELEKQILETENQCIDLRASIVSLENNKALVANSNYKGGSLYSRLRENMTSAKIEKQALQSRRTSLKSILTEEMKKEQISEAELFGLEELNKEYSLMVRKQERINGNIVALEKEIEDLRPMYKSVSHAALPSGYEGLGFREFLLIGPIIALIVPLIFAVFVILFDSRIRTSQQLNNLIPNNIALLEVIPHFNSPMGIRVVRNTIIGFICWAIIVICGYVVLGVIGLGAA